MKEQEMKTADQNTLDMLRKINLCAARASIISTALTELEEAKAEYEIKRKVILGGMLFELKQI